MKKRKPIVFEVPSADTDDDSAEVLEEELTPMGSAHYELEGLSLMTPAVSLDEGLRGVYVMCKTSGGWFRPALACSVHSQGYVKVPEMLVAKKKNFIRDYCVGCTSWVDAVAAQIGVSPGGKRKRPRAPLPEVPK